MICTAIRNQYRLHHEGLQISDKYHFNNTMLKLWTHNGNCTQAWLDTVLLARGHYQEANKELKKSRGNMGYKKGLPH